MDQPFAPTPEPWGLLTPSPPPMSDVTQLLLIAEELRNKAIATRLSVSLQPVPECSESINGRAIDLARSACGCRILQKELSVMRDSHRIKDIVAIAGEVVYSPNVFKKLVSDKFANYVIQDIVRALPADHPIIDTMADILLCYPADVLATDQHGSHVLVAILTQSLAQSGPQKRRGEILVHALLQRVTSLAKDYHASQVLCFALGAMASSKALLGPLAARSLDLSLHRYGYKVIQSALTRASSQALGMFEASIRDNLTTLITHEFGGKVIMHVLSKQRLGYTSITHAQAPLYCSILAGVTDDKCLVALVNDALASRILLNILELSHNRRQLLDRIFMWSIDVKDLVQTESAIEFVNEVIARFMGQRLN